MTKITSLDPAYPNLVLRHMASKGDRFADENGLLWQKFHDNDEIFFISIERGTPDTNNIDGKWDKFYGPNNIQDQMSGG